MQNFKKDQQIPLVQVTDPNTGQTYYAPQNVVYDEKNNNGSQYLRNVIVDQAATASYFSGSITNAISASYATTASYLLGSIASASFATSASYALTASYLLGSVASASYALSASYAATASFATTAADILVFVKNQSGNTIAKGVVVRITGSNNSSDIPRIVTASYENDNNSANTLGITNQSIANGSEGYVMTEGILLGIDTNAFISGQLIYLGATGSITGSAPRAPLHAVRLGEVIRHQSNNGSIYVRIDNGYELGELHDVVDNTTTSSYGDLLVKSGSVWTNSRQLTGSYAITGSLTATSFTGSFSGSTAAPGATTQVIFNNGGVLGANSGFVYSGSRVGIVTTSPSYSLDVSGSTYSRRVLVGNDSGSIAQADFYHRATNGGAYFMIRDVNNNNTLYLAGASGTSQIIAVPTNIGLGASTLTSTNRVTIRGLGATSGTTALRVENTNASASLVVLDNGSVYSNGLGFISTNTGFGLAAFGNNISSSAIENTAFGASTLSAIVTGTRNTAIGYNVLPLNTTGLRNTSVGAYAMSNNSVGSDNVAIGMQSMWLNTSGSTNTAVGEYSLYSNTTANNNVALGNSALFFLNTGSSNVSIGQSAGRNAFDGIISLSSSANSIFVGYDSRANANGETNQIVIGYQAIGIGSNTVVLGNSSIITTALRGNVGIGTTTPSASLHISGASSAALLRVDSPSSSSILFVSGSGNVGIGTSLPTQKIDVDGNVLLRLGGSLYLRDTTTYIYEGSGLNLVSGLTRNIRLNAGGTDRLFVSASGLVGIGTTTPLVALDTRGTAIFNNASGASYNENIRLPEASTGYASIALGGAIAASGTSATQWTILKYPAASSNTFAIRNNTTDYLSITTAGNVGIGSSFITPTARLQVRGSGATSATTTFLLQNSSPINLMTVLDNGQTTFTSPIISLATAQSAFTISQSISASNVVGGQYYGVNITPTFFSTTGSQTETALRVAATFTGSAAATGGTNIIADFGATSAGSQLTVTDVTSGSIYMVNDVSGLPIIEATSDWTVNMYNFPNLIFQKTGSRININGTLNVSGSAIITNGLTVTGSLIAPSITGSLLGTASYAIQALSASYVSGSVISPGATTQVVFNNGGVLGANSGLVYSGSNVGIGTSTPAYRLDVSGSDARINSVRIGLGGGNVSTNIAVGDGTLSVNTSGNNNAAFGFYVLSSHTTGIGNTALGFGNLYALTSGNNNVSIGREAARYIADGVTALTTSNQSIFIGAFAKALANSSVNEMVIGYSATGLGSNTVVLGNDSITRTALKGNVSIGTTGSISSTLHVKGSGTTSATTALRVENTNASASLVVLDNGSVYSYGPKFITTNTAFGAGAHTNLNSGSFNTAFGANAQLSLTNGRYNTAVGTYTNQNLTTAEHNTSIGYNALYNNISGSGNTALGTHALFLNTAPNNTAVGGFSSFNTTIGGFNTTLGYSSLYANVSGINNVSVGYASLYNLNTGSENISLGTNAGRYVVPSTSPLSSSAESIFIGNNARANANGETNQIVIGTNANGLGSNTVVLGNSSITRTALQGNVSIGTTGSINSTLYVSGSGTFTNGLTVTGSLISPSITGSLLGTASYATQALSASWAPGGGASFPYTGSAEITGSLGVTGSFTVTNGTANLISTVDTLLKDSGANTSIDWGSRILYDATSTAFINWDSVGNGGVIDAYNSYFRSEISDNVQDVFSASPFNYEGRVIRGARFDSFVTDYNYVQLASDGKWYTASIDSTSNTAKGMMGISFSVGARDCVLLEGDLTITSTTPGTYDCPSVASLGHGKPIYLSSSLEATTTLPTTSGQYVRILGHAYYQNSSDLNLWIMHFRPDHTWVQL